MSAYKRIQTEFKNLESLKKALEDCGLRKYTIAPDPRQNTLRMEGYASRPDANVAVLLSKSDYHAFEDVGFEWTGNAYTAHVSTHDGKYGIVRYVGEETLNQIKQRYAYHEIVRQAKLKGYAVKTIEQGATIRLQLVEI